MTYLKTLMFVDEFQINNQIWSSC